MNKEEKEAIAELKEQIKQDIEELPYSEESLQYKQKILNLIEKLQKENEELKVDNKKLNDLLMFSELDYISKDIIKDKIEELEEIKNKGDMAQFIAVTEKIKVLNELLGE